MGRRLLRFGVLAAALAPLALAPVALASHEKGGYLDVAIGANGHLTGHVQYIHTNAAATCPPSGGMSLSTMTVHLDGPAGYVSNPGVTGITANCTASAIAETGIFDADASAGPNGIYNASLTSCCRIAGINNTASANTTLAAAVRRQGTQPASSPIISSNVSLGISIHAAYAQNLNATDPDGPTLTYALLQGLSSGAPNYDVEAPTSNIVALDGFGQMTIGAATTAGLPVPGYYVAKVRVSDPDGGYAVRDVLMSTTTNRPPALAGSAWTVQVIAGRTATVNFAASDPDVGQSVTFQPAGLPGWAGLGGTTGSPATATLTLAPPAGTPPQTISANIDAVDDDPTVTMRSSRQLQIQVLADSPTVATPVAPAALSADRQPAFGLTPSIGGAPMECSLDGGAWTACATTWQPGAPLADGPHQLKVRIPLAGGGTGDPTTYNWTVDTTPPGAPVVVNAPVGSVGKGHTVDVDVAGEPDGTFECGLDGGVWMTCGAAQHYANLTPGGHSIAIHQIDAAGNVGPTTVVSFKVGGAGSDGSTPDDGRPSRVDMVAAPSLGVDGGTVAIGCRLDAGALARCEVNAYITVTRGGKARRVLVGRGATDATPDPSAGAAAGGGAREATVSVKLNGKGRQLACSASGVRVTFDVRAIAREGATVSTSTSATVRTPQLIVVPSDGMFRSGHVDLMPRGARSLLRIAHRLVGVPALRCTGHTDSDGPSGYNQQLGSTRARVTCGFLRRHGVRSHMTTASRGESHPRATNRTARGRALNRRVDIAVRCDAGTRRHRRS